MLVRLAADLLVLVEGGPELVVVPDGHDAEEAGFIRAQLALARTVQLLSVTPCQRLVHHAAGALLRHLLELGCTQLCTVALERQQNNALMNTDRVSVVQL